MGGGTGIGYAEESEVLSKKEARQLVNQLFPIKIKRGELANKNKAKLQEIVGYTGNLSKNNSNYHGVIINEKVSKGVKGKREGYFLIDEKTGDAYQIPKKRVLIDNGTVEGVLINMKNLNKDTNPANGRFYGKIKLEEKVDN